MSKLQLNVDLSINDKLSAALERAIKPAQQLSEKFSALKEQAEKFKLSDIDTKSLEKLKSDADGVVNKVESLGDELKKLGEIKAKLEYFEALKKQTAEASTSLDNHKKSIKALQSQMQAGGGDSTLKKQLADLEKEAKKLQNTVDKNRPKLKKMRQDFNDAGLGGMKLSEAQVKIAQSIKRTELAIDQQEGSLKQLNTAHENHSRAIQRSLEKQKEFAKQAEQSSRKIERQQQIIQKAQEVRGYGMEALRVAGAVAGGAGYAVKEYAQSQDAETTLKISMMSSNGEVAKEYAKIVALAEKMGTKLPGTTADFKKMMSVLVQQGISFQSILGGVGESAGNLAVLLKMPFDEAAEFAAKLQDATKTTEKDMMHLMDTVQKMYYLGADTVNIMGGFGNLSSSMAVLGKSGKEFVDEVAPLLVMADQAGMNGDSAGNAYRKIFASMMDTNGINKALADAGVNAHFDFTDGKGEWGGLEKMFSQLEQLKGIDTQKRLEVLSAAFGGDAEVARALNVMIEKGQAGYDETIAKMARQADINQRVQEQLGTLTNLWDALSGTFTSLLARAGEALAPWVESITVWLTELGEKMSAFIERNPAVFNAFIKFAAVLGVAIAAIAAFVVIVSSVIIPLAALKMSLVSLGGTFGFIGKGFGVFSKIPAILGLVKSGFMVAAGAVKAFTVGLLTSPIGLIGLALVAAAVVIYKYWKPISAFFKGVWSGISEAFAPIKPLFESIGNFIKPAIDWFKSLFSTTQAGEGNARQLGHVFGVYLVGVFETLTAPIRAVWSVLEWVWDGISNLLGKPISVGDIFGSLREKWEKILESLDGYWQKAQALWDKFTGIFKKSPSSEPAQSGGGGGFWSSLISGFGEASQSIGEKMGSLWDSAGPKLETAKTGLTAKVSEIWSSVTNVINGSDGGPDIAATVGNKIQTVINATSQASTTLSSVFAALINVVGVSATGMISIIGVSFSAIPTIVSAGVVPIPAIFAAALGALPKITAIVFSGMAAAASAGMSALALAINSKMQMAVLATKMGFIRITQTIASSWRQMGSAMSGNPILSRMQSATGAVLSYLNGVKGRFFAIGADIVGGLASGMNSRLGELRKTATQIAAVVENSARQRLDTHSPSRVMALVGRDVVAGLDVGMKRRFVPMLKGFRANIGKLASPDNITRVSKAVSAIGSATGSDNVLGDLARIVAPKLSNNPLVGFALNQIPKVLGQNTPKPANVTPIQSRPMPLDTDGYKGAGGGQASTSNYTIHIHANPGMDERTLAKLVQAELERYEQRKAAKHRARMTD